MKETKEKIKECSHLYKYMKLTKEETEECSHIYKLQRIETEEYHYGSTAVNYFYKKVGYVVCEKCGNIIKQDF